MTELSRQSDASNRFRPFAISEQALLAAGLALLAMDAVGRVDGDGRTVEAARRLISRCRELQIEIEAASFGEVHDG